MPPAKAFDVVVLGGGPGGYVAAIRAAQLGLHTALVERDRLGGICLNWGCIPSKALLKSAEVYHLFRHAEDFGLRCEKVQFDFEKIIQRSRQAADRLSKGVEYLMRKNKIEVIAGEGRLVDAHTLEVSGKNGSVTLSAKNVIMATGARPRSLPNVQIDGKRVISSTEAMLLREPPRSMIVIGGGPIGVEFAYFYNAFGTSVTVLEMMPSLLPMEDKEITDLLTKSLKKQGIQVATGSRVETIAVTKKGVEIEVTSNGEGKAYEGDVALMAIGVQGNSDGIGLEEIGVVIEKSFIKVDKTYRTSVEGIYAIGDVIGPPLLAHVASHEGIVAAESIAGFPTEGVDYTNIPSCTYCHPQVASIGLTEERAKEQGYEVKVGRFPFRANGRAIAVGETEGLVKLVFDAKYGELLGAHVIGAEASEMIAELGIAKSLEATNKEILRTVHAHPTLAEAVMEAAGEAFGEAIHI